MRATIAKSIIPTPADHLIIAVAHATPSMGACALRAKSMYSYVPGVKTHLQERAGRIRSSTKRLLGRYTGLDLGRADQSDDGSGGASIGNPWIRQSGGMVVASGCPPVAHSSGGEDAVLALDSNRQDKMWYSGMSCLVDEGGDDEIVIQDLHIQVSKSFSCIEDPARAKPSGEAEMVVTDAGCGILPADASTPTRLSCCGAETLKNIHGTIMGLAVKLNESSAEANANFVEELEEISEATAYGNKDAEQ